VEGNLRAERRGGEAESFLRVLEGGGVVVCPWCGLDVAAQRDTLEELQANLRRATEEKLRDRVKKGGEGVVLMIERDEEDE